MSKVFAINRRQRVELADQLFHKDLTEKLKPIADKKAYGRVKLALGITRISDLILDKKRLAQEMSEDRTTHNRIELEDAAIDFLLEKVFTLDMPGYRVDLLAPFMEALDVAKTTGTAPPVDETVLPVPANEPWEHKKIGDEDESRYAVLIKDKAGELVAGIRYTGAVDLKAQDNFDEAAQLFWSSVIEFMPPKIKEMAPKLPPQTP